jgi:hypothetical protein
MGTQKKGNPRIRMLDQSLLGFEKQSKEQLGLLHAEVREFLSRYEHLNYQVDPGRADAEQVAWSVVTRFFVPWLASRQQRTRTGGSRLLVCPNEGNHRSFQLHERS